MISPPEGLVLTLSIVLGAGVVVLGVVLLYRLRRKLRTVDRRLDVLERRQRVEHLADLLRAGEAAGHLDADAARRLDAWLDGLRSEVGAP